MSGKVVFIGLDGATWTILGPLVEKGVMPNLGKLMRNGSWGGLTTPLPPSTSPGWPSLLTGKNPGGIGIFGFKDIKSDRYNPPLAQADAIRSRMLFEYASDAGKKVCVLGFPMTYPVRKVNGVMVAGFLTPPNAKDFYYPDSIGKLGLGHLITEGYRPVSDVRQSDALELLDSLEETAGNKSRTFMEVAARDDWDLFMVCYSEPDRVFHFLWKYLDQGCQEYAEPGSEKVRARTEDVFGKIDQGIGELYSHFGEDANYVIGSDHGFRMTPPKNFHMNEFLRRAGYLKSNMNSLKRLLYKNKIIGRGEDELESPDYSPVNWRKTRAWSIPHQCGMSSIYINRKDRFRLGIVEPGEMTEKIVSDIVDRLKGLEHDGRPVVERVIRHTELYSGKYIEYGPELMVVFSDSYDPPVSLRLDLKGGVVIDDNPAWKKRSGTHDVTGVYVMSGPDVKPLERSGDIKLEALAPSMLYLLGVPISKDLDEEPALGLIEISGPGKNEPVYTEGSEYVGMERDDAASDDESIEEQLKNLGYM